ncbi:MAG: excinuclease ABC subunit UvrC [Desulfovibrio sp.]|jgi:excinuclease ABC subunit C|nr:excinuclease ABC subunit UvrC [Desulfovibrio sp.]
MQKPDLSLFPEEPGVYLYKDSAGHILYVGKAKHLRRRLTSYFRKSASLPQKTQLMLQHAQNIEILRTGTEKEALLLEASLIKKYRPRYNIVLRDDKEYLLFRIDGKVPYPRVEIVRRSKEGGKSGQARYFGPYSSGMAARETWRLIHRHFPLRRCRDAAFANRTRPCLYYDIGQCLAPCVLPVDQQVYKTLLGDVALLLSGKTRVLARALKEEMRAAARSLRFEDAARLRDQIRALEKTLERQSVVLDEDKDLDLAGLAQLPQGLALGVVFVRGGLLLDGRNFFWAGLGMEDAPELLTGFVPQYYLQRRGLGESIPPRIVLPWIPAGEESSFQTLEAALAEIRGAAVQISAPKGRDEDNLSRMAASNAREAALSLARPVLADLLQKRFRSFRPIRRIEAVDISHTGGSHIRAGMVVFEDEKALKGEYRAYNIEARADAAGGDDYAALAAWAERRAERQNDKGWPDLILIDGGRGQLSAVNGVFSAKKLKTGLEADADFILASIAKARDESGHTDRRAGKDNDRIFLPGRSNPLNFPAGAAELLYLQHIRDTAHNFVVSRHRRARTSAALAGELTAMPGIGPKLARALFERFGSLVAMAGADVSELAATPGIGRARAELVRARLSALFEK